MMKTPQEDQAGQGSSVGKVKPEWVGKNNELYTGEYRLVMG